IDVAVADPVLGEDCWVYSEPQDAGAQLTGFQHHYRLYTTTEPNYTGKVSVPVLWDRHEGRIVIHESAAIILIHTSAFDHLTGNEVELYPASLRAEIDGWNELVYDKVNNGVYRAGFAKKQTSDDAAVGALFETLGTLEERLDHSRYLTGPWLTEAD